MTDVGPPKFLSPTNDLIFKVILERNRSLLNAMLSAVLGRGVEVEEILNPGLPGEGVQDKMMLLDVRVRFTDGTRAFVEMQTSVRVYQHERFLGYLCREYASQPKRGEPYAAMTPTIGVVWQVGAPRPEYGFHEVFRFRGERSGEVYSESLSLHVLQLGLAPRRRPPGGAETESERYVRLWARFLSVKSPEELEELEQEEPAMSDAASTLKTVTLDPEVARLAREREESEYFYQLALRKERAEGEAKGKAEGKAEGEAKGKAETILKLITLKFGHPGEAVQARVRGASLEELDRYAGKMFSAQSVEELLAD